jgi:hypothetical protein
VANPVLFDQPTNDPLAASTRLVQSTIELARAELRLALTRTGVLLHRAFVVLIAVAIAMPFVQVTLALLALAPLLGAVETPLVALLAVGIPCLVSAVAGLFLYRTARSLTRDLQQLSRGE